MMTQEEKAKAYDEAIEFAYNKHRFSSNLSEIKLIEEIFPQLLESEGDRIRKAIIKMISDIDGGFSFEKYGILKKDALAWLENQGQKSKRGLQEAYRETLFKIATILSQHEDKEDSPFEKIREIMIEGDFCPMDLEDKEKIEQNPAWSEEDDGNLEGIIDEIEANKNNAPDYDLATYDRFLSWLKLLKDRVGCEVDCATTKEWKPTKGQIKALEDLIQFLGCTKKVREDLKSLYEQLKKLRGE